MSTGDNSYLKGWTIPTNFNSKLFGELKQNVKFYYLMFNKFLDVDNLFNLFFQYKLKNKNEKIIIRTSSRIKEVSLLSWNKRFNNFVFYDKKQRYTLIVNRVGVKIFVMKEGALDEVLHMFLNFERGGFLS